MRRSLLLFALLLVATPALAADPWSTYRGNPQRTGNTDGKPGPTKPAILWVHKSNAHCIGAPVPVGERLYLGVLAGLGGTAGEVWGLDVSPRSMQRVAWSKGQPLLKRPTVSSPAFADGKLILGEGMHQTDDATLYCLQADTGRALWQLAVPGTLVHLEGGPTVADGKVYMGGGAAGAFCVDLNKVTLNGKEMDVAGVPKILDGKWAELQKKYQDAKKTDPFAQPPTEDQLPKPSPVRLWQQGEKKWHVDAPVAVADGKVLVASAFLDKEKVGDRALHCLDAATGKPVWRAALQFNPWGGPSVQGKTVVTGGSSVALVPNLLKGAKGEIVAFNLDDGKEKWRKAIPTGGIVSSVVLTRDLAICVATDGKVRAFDLANGDRRWIYDARTPFFAPPALAGDVVYAGDLKGVIHAIGLADGLAKWTFDIGNHPEVKAPGMIYAGPVVQDGRLYVATCNLAGASQNQPTVVVCIGDK